MHARSHAHAHTRMHTVQLGLVMRQTTHARTQTLSHTHTCTQRRLSSWDFSCAATPPRAGSDGGASPAAAEGGTTKASGDAGLPTRGPSKALSIPEDQAQ